ncbi:MAG: hypothetical protein ACW98K_04505 [Candidatus Kariarchaeaceae archaeon]
MKKKVDRSTIDRSTSCVRGDQRDLFSRAGWLPELRELTIKVRGTRRVYSSQEGQSS